MKITITSSKQNKKHLEHWQKVSLYLIAYDIVAVTFAYFFTLLLRFDFAFSHIPYNYYHNWQMFAPVYAVICIVIFWRLKLYRSIWRFASFVELERITLVTLVTAVLHAVLITVIFGRMPMSYYFGGAMLQFLLLTVVRFSYRFILLLRANSNKSEVDRIMIVGNHSIIGAT